MRRAACCVLLAVGCFSESDIPGGTMAGTSEGTDASTGCDGAPSCAGTSSSSTGSDEVTGTVTSSTMGEAEVDSSAGETSSTTPGSEVSTATMEESTSGHSCTSLGCAECAACTFSNDCKPQYSACSDDDPVCHDTVVCFEMCLAGGDGRLMDCVAQCPCTNSDLLTALLDCAASVCVEGGACPMLPACSDGG